jgi:hypothetical protein
MIDIHVQKYYDYYQTRYNPIRGLTIELLEKYMYDVKKNENEGN